jgi:hypothetical protein
MSSHVIVHCHISQLTCHIVICIAHRVLPPDSTSISCLIPPDITPCSLSLSYVNTALLSEAHEPQEPRNPEDPEDRGDGGDVQPRGPGEVEEGLHQHASEGCRRGRLRKRRAENRIEDDMCRFENRTTKPGTTNGESQALCCSALSSYFSAGCPASWRQRRGSRTDS